MSDLILLAHVPTASVNEGFLPAAKRLGLSVTLLTDHADAHRKHFGRPGLPAYPDEIFACDVFNPVAVIERISDLRADAVFSNSDHLQTSAAIAAQYFGLPGKDWRVAYRAKNKAEMRRFAAAQGAHALWHAVLSSESDVSGATNTPFPCVVKPREGVGSQLVRLVENARELEDYCRAVWLEQPGRALLIEEYVSGGLHTLETLGDGTNIRAIGGFRVTLAEPPHFVELEAEWGDWLTAEQNASVLRQIEAFGVGFGSCHTEFVLTEAGPRLIEINYRTVGDQREFLLEEALGFPLFETILRLHLGEPLPKLDLPSRAAAMRYVVADRAGELIAAPDEFAETKNGVRLSYRALRRSGDRVSVTNSNKDYLGVLSASAPDSASLAAAMAAAGTRLGWEIRS
ncbi:ATP-grasp domain-containing protein [Methylosinus sp. Ce-a6]|uniref:ATP-grasp domain-containing protein n=1 Tax=Methylosinus sp. Ce-a6 TaxID=2172005 RepID=UPI001357FE00|nr:ATP-grasp domain-containing protein [Methylosinus sp. Ce-a6]